MVHGTATREIAERLLQKRYAGVDLFYDHGDSRRVAVCTPTSYIGRRFGADATLSGIDIVLVYRGKVFLLVELEESEVRPKTVLGDVFGVVVAGHVRIKGRSYPIEDATLIVGVTVSGRGRRAEKYGRLERHLSKYVRALRHTAPRTRVTKVRIVASQPHDFLRRIEGLVHREVSKTITAR